MTSSGGAGAGTGTPASPNGPSYADSPVGIKWAGSLPQPAGRPMASHPLVGSKDSLASAATGLATSLPPRFGASSKSATALPPLQLPPLQLPGHAASLPLALSSGPDPLAAVLGLSGEQPPALERWDSVLLDFNGEAVGLG